MAVTSALTEQQRKAIVIRFTFLNPHYAGAGSADILGELANADSDLDRTEPFFEAHRDLIVDGCGYAARALIWSGGELTETAMRDLLAAAGLIRPSISEGGNTDGGH
jgi:hypothetical protein